MQKLTLEPLVFIASGILFGCAATEARDVVSGPPLDSMETEVEAPSRASSLSPLLHDEVPKHENEFTFALGEFNETGEKGVRIGLDYERRNPDGWTIGFDEKWGFGALIDFDAKPVESVLLGAMAVYHPIEPVSLIMAPGYAFISGREDSWVLRLGSRYSFQLSEQFKLGPEIFYDIGEGGRRKGVFAIGLSYSF